MKRLDENDTNHKEQDKIIKTMKITIMNRIID
jgi:hypothetical protein